jgi:hypothetical protein
VSVADIAAWHDYFVAMVGAAAALAGLIFVALSLNYRFLIGHPLWRDRTSIGMARAVAAGSLLSLMMGLLRAWNLLFDGHEPADTTSGDRVSGRRGGSRPRASSGR